jgi:riboflavin kinase/FMN adenylyltransferase
MRITRGPGEVGYAAGTVVTIGSFDGMHLGHRAIVSEVLTRSRAVDGRSVVVTFTPHPRAVVGDGTVKLLTTLDERLELMDGAGVDVAMVLNFTYEFSRQSAAEFYERYVLNGTGVSEVVVGHDHAFGRDREASISSLTSLGTRAGFGVTTIGAVTVGGKRVSSSAIRSLLAEGGVAEAGMLLGRPYGLSGRVVPGDGRGTAIGFPTANILPGTPEKIVPGRGVYLVEADVRGTVRHGMLNIGTRPTFVEGGGEVVELHLFDWSDTITGEEITVRFLRYIREEKKFSNTETFITQLERDRSECLRHIQSVH